MFFLRKTSTVHIELLFRNAPAKSSRTDFLLVWFAGATPDFGGIEAIDTEFPYRVPIVDRGAIAVPLFADPVSDS